MSAFTRTRQEAEALCDWMRELRAAGNSYRKIGRVVGMSDDAVMRWLAKGPPQRPRTTMRAQDPAIVAEMIRMRKRGMSARLIAKELKVNYQTVYRRTRGYAPGPKRHQRDAMAGEVERLMRRFEESQTPENYRVLREAVRKYEGLTD